MTGPRVLERVRSEKPPEPEGSNGFSSWMCRAVLLSVNQRHARLIKKRTPSTIKTTTAMPTIPSPPMPAASTVFLPLSVPSPSDSQAETGHEDCEHQRHHRPEESRGLTQLFPQGVGARGHGSSIPTDAGEHSPCPGKLERSGSVHRRAVRSFDTAQCRRGASDPVGVDPRGFEPLTSRLPTRTAQAVC